MSNLNFSTFSTSPAVARLATKIDSDFRPEGQGFWPRRRPDSAQLNDGVCGTLNTLGTQCPVVYCVGLDRDVCSLFISTYRSECPSLANQKCGPQLISHADQNALSNEEYPSQFANLQNQDFLISILMKTSHRQNRPNKNLRA